MRVFAGGVTLLLGAVANAAPPGFEGVFPAGGQTGRRVEVKVSGKDLEKTSPQAWVSEPRIAALAGEKPKTFFLGIGPEVAAGPYLMRLHTRDGVTPPRIIEVGKFEEVPEKESNDALADVQAAGARMNVTFNGVLEKSGDVDTFAIRAQKGRVITLELHGYALGSPMDPAMRLLDAHGVEVAAGHDTHNLDPRIQHVPSADGALFVQVFAFAHPPAADVAFKGSANHIYRLIASDGPAKTAPADEPEALVIPTTIKGCIAKPNEEDAFIFTAKKGDDLQISACSREVRGTLDATLRVEDAGGKVLQQADDENGGLDPALRWKAPKDGTFKLVVADRFRQGSADHGYELSARPFAPSLKASLDTHAYRVEAGKSVEVKLGVKVDGKFEGKIQARATRLPAGVTAEPVEVPAKGGEVKLTLKAAAEAAESQAPFAVEIVTSAPDVVQIELASYTIPFTEPRGDLLITSDTHPWLGVAAKKP
ncbi:MAG: PPC domain-containing protein [Verrucomicrobiaceae bacterium]|nr:PPC domain-containing protein [Verrucomicrobiaceae bacterium]